jgi:hypothetical protein
LASKKGRNKGGGKLGNKNGAKGPRVGRKDKTTEPLPQPRPEAKLPWRRRRAKTGGHDFPKGQNSHSGEPFQRGPDLIPRGNGTLLLKVVRGRRVVPTIAGSVNGAFIPPTLFAWLGVRSR